jgi:predicted amidohydrolase YtcJ
VNIRTVRLALQFLALFNAIPSLAGGQGLIVEPADIIVVHGRVYTEDAKQPWAQAVAIRGAKIAAVGDDASIEKMRGMGTKVVNAGGKLVLPGFTDCHVHFLDGSLSLGRVNLAGAKDVAEIQKRLREYTSKHPDDDWILGRGWNYAMFGPEAVPHKKYLDELFPDRPVFLESYDGRTYLANSKALALAGITRETPNPPNGIIVRDPLTGEATGALKESAQDLVTRLIPKPTRAEKLLALRAGMKWANQHGITRVHSAGGDFAILDLFQEMRQRGDLSVRMYVSYFLQRNRSTLQPFFR